MTSLYTSVITTTHKHLGPAADRFVARQIRSHLQKDPDTLQPDDLRELIDWIQLAMRLVTTDGHKVDAYVIDLRNLVRSKEPTAHVAKVKG